MFTLNSVCAREKEHYSFVDIGTGIGYMAERTTYGSAHIGLTQSVYDYGAFFIDYMGMFNKNNFKFHEISVKAGPFIPIYKNNYVALSSGFSIITYTGSKFSKGNSGIESSGIKDNYFNIPVQLKINVGIYKNFCMGFKGTYNFMLYKEDDDENMCNLIYYWSFRF